MYLFYYPTTGGSLHGRHLLEPVSLLGCLFVQRTYVFLALLIYDYFLTLPLEISEIWKSQFTVAKLFYFLNRYGSIAYYCLNCLLVTFQTESISVSSSIFLVLCCSS